MSMEARNKEEDVGIFCVDKLGVSFDVKDENGVFWVWD